MDGVFVRVVTRSAALEAAIKRNLANVEHIHFDGEPGDSAHVIVATAPDCPPAECAQWTRSGWKVVILTPVPRDAEGASYRAAGVHAYIGMELVGLGLRETILQTFDPGNLSAAMG